MRSEHRFALELVDACAVGVLIACIAIVIALINHY